MIESQTNRCRLHRGAFLATRLAAVALVARLATGCTLFGSHLVVNSIYLQNPQMTVRGTTRVTIAAASLPGETIHYRVSAMRGRVYQDKDTDNIVTYYAPFTSSALDQNGNRQPGDVLEVEVSDDTGSIYRTQNINLIGDSIVFKEDSGDCGVDTDCNGTLYAGTVDTTGTTITDIRPLADTTGKALVGAEPTISPDGKHIAYVYYPGNGTSAIYTLDAEGQTLNLTGSQPNSGFNIDPTWSPYGDQIAYVSDQANPGVFDIFRIPAGQQGGQPTQVTTSSNISQRFPNWNPVSASSNFLAVSAQATLGGQGNLVSSTAWNVFLLNLSTGTYTAMLSNLTGSSSLGPDFALEPHWDPTGQSVAYTQRGPVANNQAAASRFQRIFVQCAKSGPGSAVVLNPTEQSGASLAESNPLWNPSNGTQVAYLRYTIDSQDNPSTPMFYIGTPPALCGGSSQPSTFTQGPRQWGNITQQVPALRVLSTSGLPVEGNEMDWR
ncbi:MAG: PD40 domain-containing protein [Cyanobacteria bacterium REEB65]|nr:PD40 domain-containing protein [Cyanobacteria bacterium REEB65]